jgi:hypothetical protein
MPRDRRRLLAGLLAVAAIGLSGCVSTQAVTAAGTDEPAKVEPVPGTSLHKLVLTEAAVGRVGIKTETVTAKGIPLAAVVYDKDGATWTYTNPDPSTYVRAAVTLGAVDGDVAALRQGPAAGTAVVTVGAAELLGTEFGVGTGG